MEKNTNINTNKNTNKNKQSVTIFEVVFTLTYLFLCYYPPLRIKLDAKPIEYFIESIRHAAIQKFCVSLVVGLAAAYAPQLMKKLKAEK